MIEKSIAPSMTRPKGHAKQIIDPSYRNRQITQRLNESCAKTGLTGIYKTRLSHELALLGKLCNNRGRPHVEVAFVL